MSDWRTKPRTGKTQFFPLLDEIRRRRSNGETVRQMHDDLTKREAITIGYDQFAKYIRKEFAKPQQPSVRPVPQVDETHPFAKLTTPQVQRRESDESLHPSMPDRSKIYGPPQD